PMEEPAGYDPSRFELLRRYLAVLGERAEARRLLGLVPDLLANGKCDVNSIGPFSLNLLDSSNRAYPDGDAAMREAVRARHLAYSHELLYFLAHDRDVPEQVCAEVARWSLCADEFTDTGGWPHQLYVREARRMVGSVVLTEGDLRHPTDRDDAIAQGSYNIDVREVERTWRYLPEYHRRPVVLNEGYLSIAVPPYPIPYGCLLPGEGQVDNLLVPVCCSTSHVAFASVRTEPTLMALGEAAGLAAAIAARSGRSPGRLEPRAVRQALEKTAG
ncbi:MAG: hypothetical protein JWM85_362, partial [Acidimicrobiaceae bacterium]|nr:hypothetical protein [Acidimicrobiaceae bacterium]